jgi:integrase
LLDAAEDYEDRLRALWTLAAHSGCRLGELLALQWSAVDFERRSISIRQTLLTTVEGVPTFGEPKSASSRRTLTLDADAITSLRAHRDRQTFERQALGDAYAPYDLVFATETGAAYTASAVSHRFKSALGRAGLPRSIRFHDLRHASATAMLAAGIHAKAASARLGHSTIGITLDLYTHPLSGLDQDAAAKIGEVLREARS